MNFEHSMIHRAPGIDDADSAIYREYDQSGRNQNAFQQRATLAGIKNLQTTAYRQDSPVRAVRGRFPEKFNAKSDKHTPTDLQETQYHTQDRESGRKQDLQNQHPNLNPHATDNKYNTSQKEELMLNSDQVIANVFPDTHGDQAETEKGSNMQNHLASWGPHPDQQSDNYQH